ncbi:hypothetical protein BGW36DRAFT_377930 [Talaromyces proteolyticus]|uniref:Translation initiation factor IF-2, mitochondrial n=1 Tax=Talaromyces proteolyticus TaxID=1131652 RepID=A0AAD4KUK7_9EURO|nr:uncharacterized protein BGW36DRAFT_377930 [Talaromyces proteolyticus]KAH8697101.1 hypothetical protein BGW36DRAFT_377930 [Talaromyces proteolyticus]
MHRRALGPICRCQYFDLAYPAVARQSRAFHSSSPALSLYSPSGESAAAAKKSGDNDSSSDTSSLKNRGGWGATTFRSSVRPAANAASDNPTQHAPNTGSGKDQAQWGSQSTFAKKSVGLSFAEMTNRMAILTPEPRQGKDSIEKQASSPEPPKPPPKTPKSNEPTDATEGFSMKILEKEMKKLSRLSRWRGLVPPSIRSINWKCPDCSYMCFGKHCQCPQCRAVRPGLRKAFEEYKKETMDNHARIDNDRPTIVRPASFEQRPAQLSAMNFQTPDQHTDQERDFKIRKLGESAIDSWRKNHDRAAAFELHHTPLDANANMRRSEESRKPEKRWEDETETREEERKEHDVRRRADEDPIDWETPQKKRARPVRREQFLYDDENYDPEERKQRRDKRKQKKKPREVVEAPSPLYLPEFISVNNLATVLGVRQAEFIDHLEEIGFEGVIHSHVLDAETAGLIAAEYNFEPIFETDDQDLKPAAEPEDKSLLPSRPPVVTIMGHVDHGKTTLLDWLRKSSVAASEHGGITQHIGAFSVSMPSGKSITFLDTPGHAAFLDMRRRGADMTDIVVLVVAADDSVKPQTIEAINHAKQANVPIIVAINKIDKDNVNPEKVKQDLARHSVDVEDYGGDVQAIPVSGKTGKGMVELEEAIVTLSELLDHRADIDGNAEGWVVEATTKKAGRVATILVKRGTVRPGDILVAGSTWTRIKTLRNETGTILDKASPGMPVEVDGWKEQPEAGSQVLQAPSEQRAKEAVDYRMERMESKKLGQDATAINESRRETIEQRRREESEEEDSEAPETTTGPRPINFIVKADVFGSVEAVTSSVSGIGNNEIFAQVLRSGVGQVSEFDIKHAATSSACVINFNNAVDPAISRMAEAQDVKLMNHNIIYELIDDVKATMSEQLPPTVISRVTGEAEIGQIFDITVKGRNKMSIAGCKVRNGVISRAKKVRVLRGKDIVYDGSLSSLKNVKKDVLEMRKDTECGIGFDGWSAFEVGDHVQSYEETHEKRYLQ